MFKIFVTGADATLTVLGNAAKLMPRIVQKVAQESAEAARPITHVITGALQRSHLARYVSTMVWEVTPDPTIINVFGDKPVDYGPVEHARGGSHAFYDRMIRERLESPVMRTVNSWLEGELK